MLTIALVSPAFLSLRWTHHWCVPLMCIRHIHYKDESSGSNAATSLFFLPLPMLALITILHFYRDLRCTCIRICILCGSAIFICLCAAGAFCRQGRAETAGNGCSNSCTVRSGACRELCSVKWLTLHIVQRPSALSSLNLHNIPACSRTLGCNL